VRLIVTRVQPQARQWADRFEACGRDALVLPLIEVRGLADATAVRAAWLNLSNYKAAMFVSRHAVDYFFQAKPAPAHGEHALSAMTPRWWATGPGTAHALLAHGVATPSLDTPPEQAGQFDSEALWRQVHPQVQPGDRVLIVRGDSVTPDGRSLVDNDQGVGREWLAERLRQSGAQVDLWWLTNAEHLFGPTRSAGWRGLRQPMARFGCSAARKPWAICKACCPGRTGRPRVPWPPTRALQRRRGTWVLLW
jgi:uroporphyrinogen-III synthase